MLEDQSKLLVRKGQPSDAWLVVMRSQAYTKLMGDTRSRMPLETGGVLLGSIRYTEDGRAWIVVETAEPVKLSGARLSRAPGQESDLEPSMLEADDAEMHNIGWFYSDPGIGIFPPRTAVEELRRTLAPDSTLFLLNNPSSDEGAFYIWQDGSFIPAGGFYEALPDEDAPSIIPWDGEVHGASKWHGLTAPVSGPLDPTEPNSMPGADEPSTTTQDPVPESELSPAVTHENTPPSDFTPAVPVHEQVPPIAQSPWEKAGSTEEVSSAVAGVAAIAAIAGVDDSEAGANSRAGGDFARDDIDEQSAIPALAHPDTYVSTAQPAPGRWPVSSALLGLGGILALLILAAVVGSRFLPGPSALQVPQVFITSTIPEPTFSLTASPGSPGSPNVAVVASPSPQVALTVSAAATTRARGTEQAKASVAPSAPSTPSGVVPAMTPSVASPTLSASATTLPATATVAPILEPSSTLTSSAVAVNTQPSGTTYTVQRGDTLNEIAGRFGTTTLAIMTANNLSSTIIHTGQVLIVPTTYNPAPTQPAPTQPGPTQPTPVQPSPTQSRPAKPAPTHTPVTEPSATQAPDEPTATVEVLQLTATVEVLQPTATVVRQEGTSTATAIEIIIPGNSPTPVVFPGVVTPTQSPQTPQALKEPTDIKITIPENSPTPVIFPGVPTSTQAPSTNAP